MLHTPSCDFSSFRNVQDKLYTNVSSNLNWGKTMSQFMTDKLRAMSDAVLRLGYALEFAILRLTPVCIWIFLSFWQHCGREIDIL